MLNPTPFAVEQEGTADRRGAAGEKGSAKQATGGFPKFGVPFMGL